MQLEITEARLAFSYRCAVTDSNGSTVYSEPARMQAATDTWTYTYNADGLRTSRTDGYTTYEYIYHGSQLTQMTVGDDRLRFGYDANGTPLYVIWNQSKYFYTTNLQGDVVAIVSESGYAVVCYTYDAWGNILSITGIRADNLGILNPLRYRGYVYDHETELYYLQSRYYDPTWGRFLNADVFVSTGQGILGNNMFAYCGNNPVCYIDPSGYVSDSITGVPSKFGLLTDYGKGSSGGAGTGAGSIGTTIPFAVSFAAVETVFFYVRTAIINQGNMDKTVEEILKTKQGRIRQAPLPPGGPDWKDILQKTLREIKQLAQKNVKGYKEIYKLLTDGRFNS